MEARTQVLQKPWREPLQELTLSCIAWPMDASSAHPTHASEAADDCHAFLRALKVEQGQLVRKHERQAHFTGLRAQQHSMII